MHLSAAELPEVPLSEQLPVLHRGAGGAALLDGGGCVGGPLQVGGKAEVKLSPSHPLPDQSGPHLTRKIEKMSKNRNSEFWIF